MLENVIRDGDVVIVDAKEDEILLLPEGAGEPETALSREQC
jgi:hypothetical protein